MGLGSSAQRNLAVHCQCATNELDQTMSPLPVIKDAVDLDQTDELLWIPFAVR